MFEILNEGWCLCFSSSTRFHRPVKRWNQIQAKKDVEFWQYLSTLCEASSPSAIERMGAQQSSSNDGRLTAVNNWSPSHSRNWAPFKINYPGGEGVIAEFKVKARVWSSGRCLRKGARGEERDDGNYRKDAKSDVETGLCVWGAVVGTLVLCT